MGTVEQADDLCTRLMRAFPRWPTSMNNCPCCGKNYARGRDVCADCLELELTNIVGTETAKEVRFLANRIGALRYSILRIARPTKKKTNE